MEKIRLKRPAKTCSLKPLPNGLASRLGAVCKSLALTFNGFCQHKLSDIQVECMMVTVLVHGTKQLEMFLLFVTCKYLQGKLLVCLATKFNLLILASPFGQHFTMGHRDLISPDK